MFGVYGSGVGVYGLGFGVEVQGWEFKAEGLGCKIEAWTLYPIPKLRRKKHSLNPET